MTAFNLTGQGSGMGQYPHYMNEPTQEASSIRGDFPVHMSGPAQANADIQGKFNPNINKMNDTKMRSFETGSDIASTLYELWQFIPKNNGDGGKPWASAKRKLIPSDQGTLEDLVKSMAREEPVEEEYQSLSKRRKGLIDDLIEEHNQRDPRFRWRCVYIKTERQKIGSPLFGVRDMNIKMEIVIVRKLRQQAMPAASAFENNAAGHANPQSLGNPNGFMGNNGLFEGMGRNTASPQIIGNNPRLSKDPGNANLPAHSGMPSTHPQGHPPGHPPMYHQEQPPAHAPVSPQGHPQGNLPVHAQGNPTGQFPAHAPSNPQGHPQGNPSAQFPAHRQVSPQVQHPMPPDSNLPIFESSGNYPIGGHQGAKSASTMDRNRQQIPHHPSIGPQIGNNISQMPGSFAGNFNDEPRLSSQKGPAPMNMNNAHGRPVYGEPSIKNLPPHHARKNLASGLPPKVIQHDRQPLLYAEDSSSRTEDDESLFGDDGYTSSASSVESDSFAKGSLNWQRKYPGQTMSDQGHRVHDRKRGQKYRSHTGYPASTVDILPSTTNLRKRENKRVEDMAHHSHPVTVHGGKHGFQMPGPSEFDINSKEASYRLFSIQEQQRAMMDKLTRLELHSGQHDSHDYAGNEVAVRGMESDMPMPGRRFFPHEPPQHFYRRRYNYIPRETMPYMYEPYY